jgi:hypothetical protein
MFRRILILGAIVALAAGSTRATAQAGSPAVVSVTPFVGLLFNPCNGHQIDLTGEARTVSRIDEGGTVVLLQQVIAGVKAVDPVTGESYIFNDRIIYVLNVTAGDGFVESGVISVVFVGGSSSFRANANIHTTVAPDGTIAVNFVHQEVTCM